MSVSTVVVRLESNSTAINECNVFMYSFYFRKNLCLNQNFHLNKNNNIIIIIRVVNRIAINNCKKTRKNKTNKKNIV